MKSDARMLLRDSRECGERERTYTHDEAGIFLRLHLIVDRVRPSDAVGIHFPRWRPSVIKFRVYVGSVAIVSGSGVPQCCVDLFTGRTEEEKKPFTNP